MKKILLTLFGAAIIGSAAVAETNVGIAYGRDKAQTTSQTISFYDFWVAGTESGELLQQFVYGDTGNGPGGQTRFIATRMLKFTGYNDPFFGKVADVWLEGLYDYTTSQRVAIAHFHVTDSDYVGPTFGYFTMDIFLQGHPNSPVFSRVGWTGNNSHVLIPASAGGLAGSQDGTQGLAYGAAKMQTNRQEPAAVAYHVAYNYLYKFLYQDPNIGFIGTRVRSFRCTNSGLFGKQAEFWLDGLAGDDPKNAHTTRVARVIVTHSADQYGVDLMYIAVYHPSNLNKPLYERLCVLRASANNILCK